MFISSVTAGWLLLQQAVVASEQLSRIRSKEGLEDLDDSALPVENENTTFYSNKMKTARFFWKLSYLNTILYLKEVKNRTSMRLK